MGSGEIHSSDNSHTVLVVRFCQNYSFNAAILSTPLSMNLGFLHILAIVYNAATNMEAQLSLRGTISFPLGIYAQEGLKD